MSFAENSRVISATAGHLPPQLVNASATGAPTTGGWLAASTLLGRAVLCVAQTGAFVSTPSCAFKLSVADDANGTNAADVVGGEVATITTANTVVTHQLGIDLFDAAKFYGIRCTVTAGTSAQVTGQLRILDPIYSG